MYSERHVPLTFPPISVASPLRGALEGLVEPREGVERHTNGQRPKSKVSQKCHIQKL
jgi:hypothetical protein